MFIKYLSFLVFVVIIYCPSFLWAEDRIYQKTHECDNLAAHPNDAGPWGQKWAVGVPDEDIVPGPAISFCTQAVEQYPETIRFRFQLGRALLAGKRFDEAFKVFNSASNRGYVPAAKYLGDAYINIDKLPSGFETDVEKAKEYYLLASEAGFGPATDALSLLNKHLSGGNESVITDLRETHYCDQVGADIYDPQGWAPHYAKSFENLVPNPAIAACSQAVASYPNVPRFNYQLGRAYWKAEEFQKAFYYFQIAAEAGYVPSFKYMGDALRKRGTLPDGQNADLIMAEEWYRRYVKNTFKPEGFHMPELMKAIAYKDFDKLEENKNQALLYIKTMVEQVNDDMTYFIDQKCPTRLRSLFAKDILISRIFAPLEASWVDLRDFVLTYTEIQHRARRDTKLLIDRYRCGHPVVEIGFFRNIKLFVQEKTQDLVEAEDTPTPLEGYGNILKRGVGKIIDKSQKAGKWMVDKSKDAKKWISKEYKKQNDE